MSQERPKPWQRWFQFSLRSLLLAMTIVVGLLVAWRQCVAPYQQQAQTMALIEQLGGYYETTAADKWLRRLYGQDFQNITLVNLADCEEPAAYLNDVAHLPCLETLVVAGDKFGDEHLRRLRSTKSLTALVLDSTAVTSDALAELARALPNLDVYRSQRRAVEALREVGQVSTGRGNYPAKFDGLVGGEYLVEGRDARFQSIDDAGMKHLAQITSLQRLELVGTNVTDAGLDHLRSLPNLRDLFLSRTVVSDAGLERLKELTSLEVVWLDRTQVTDAGMVYLKGLSNLRSLMLSETDVGNAGLQHIRGLTKLRSLFLNRTRVTDFGLENVRTLTNLQCLWLNNTQVTDDGLAFLNGLANLEFLLLHGTSVSDAGVHDVKCLSKLKELRLTGTNVTSDGANELRQALPNCHIPYGE